MNSSNSNIILEVPANLRKGTLKQNELKAIQSAVTDLEYIKDKLVLDSFKDTNILDIGCGVKYSQAIIQNSISVRSYWGLDVDKKMIKFLNANIEDPIMNYRAVPFYNEMYNKDGVNMTKNSKLPIGNRKFNLMVLLSVFTHFIPKDFQNMLHILKRYLDDDGVIFFTVFINNNLKKDFKDLYPDKPLLKAVYRQDCVEKMIANAGLEIKIHCDKNEAFKTKNQYFCTHA